MRNKRPLPLEIVRLLDLHDAYRTMLHSSRSKLRALQRDLSPGEQRYAFIISEIKRMETHVEKTTNRKKEIQGQPTMHSAVTFYAGNARLSEALNAIEHMTPASGTVP